MSIRPSSTSYSLSTSSDGGIIIRVPRDSHGRRFSVEFNNDLYTYRSDGENYVYSGGDVVSVEPQNGLLIFASAFLSSDKIPLMNNNNTKTMNPCQITRFFMIKSENIHKINDTHYGSAHEVFVHGPTHAQV
ncbi:glycosyl hydrolase family 49-domain-containing protein [Aspergillus nidulans var. acristatus]